MKDKKHLLLKLLCFTFMLGSTAAGAAACKDKPTEPSIPEGYDKTFTDVGSYYADEGEARYTFELTDSTFTLKLGGQTIGGTYLFNGTTLRLVTTDGTIIEATYSDAAIKFTYNGVSYTFIKNVEYTVTFEMNGGTAQADVKVLNGKKLDKATLGTPTKGEEGEYAFFGWYKDAAFKDKYSFDQPVTKNIKLYARFVKLLGKEEFTLKLDGYTGTDFAGKTEGGLIPHEFEQYKLEAKDGAEFDGWWYSAYNDETKLTAKMKTGDAVKENLVLYPVWKTDAPTVSVYEKEIVTTAKNNSAVTIICGDKTFNGAVQNGKYDFDFAKQPAGEYVITVTDGDKETKAYYKNKALARVSQFEVVVTEQGKSELHFNAVEGAEKYLITVACGTNGHVHTDTEVKDDNGEVCTVFDFTDCDMKDGKITFAVKAEGAGYLASESSEYTVDRKLNAPANIVADDTTAAISWDAVKHAEYYLLTIDGETFKLQPGVRTYDLRKYGKGEHTFSVAAVGNGWNKSDATTYTWTKGTLAAPEKPTIVNGYTVTWGAVEGAQGYMLKIGDKEIPVNGTSYPLTDQDYTEGQTAYVVSVLAKGATAAENSLYSDTLTVTSGAMDGELKYENGTLSWNPGFGVTKYEIKEDNKEAAESIEVTGTSTKITFTHAGTTTFYVRSYNANNVPSAWVEKTVTVYTVRFDSMKGETVVDDLFVAEGDDILLPETALTATGYTFAGWFDGTGDDAKEYKKENDEYPKLSAGEDLTLFAHWNSNAYRAIYDLGAYGTGVDADGKDVLYGQDFTLDVPKSKDDNQAFIGWFTEGGTRLTTEKGIGNQWTSANDMKVVAHWDAALNYVTENGITRADKPANGAQYLNELTVLSKYNGQTVTWIGSNAFKNCYKIKKIRIPDTVTEIDRNAFLGCSALEEVEIYHAEDGGVLEGDATFSSVNGVLLQKKGGVGTVLYFFPDANKGDNGTYTVPEEVNTIGTGVFEKRNTLTKVIVPAKVKSIEQSAFSDMKNLTEVEFLAAGDGVQEVGLTIAKEAFNGCRALVKMTLPARLTDITLFATNAKGEYEQSAFKDCSKLKEIEVTGKGVEGVEAKYSSADGYLLNGNGDTIVYCPIAKYDYLKPEDSSQKVTIEVTIPDKVTMIGDRAFFGNTTINTVNIPARITYIGTSAFEGCSKITILNFNGKEENADLEIKDSAFYGIGGSGSNALTELTLAPNVRKVGEHAFGGWVNLKTLYVESTGKATFADGAFTGKTGYYKDRSTITTLHIGAGLEGVDITKAFDGKNGALATVDVDENNTYYASADNVIYNKEMTEIFFFPKGKTEFNTGDLTLIGENLFANKNLTKVTIGNKITKIGKNAFNGCKSLTQVIFETGGTAALEIDQQAFIDCQHLEAIQLPNRLTKLGDSAFQQCYKIAQITFEDGLITNLTIGKEAFRQCVALTSLSLPEGTVALGNGAFANCKELKTLAIPASMKRLGEWTTTVTTEGVELYHFESLDLFRLQWPNTTTIYYAEKLENITVAEGNERYGSKNGMLYGKYTDENDDTTKTNDLVRLYVCPYNLNDSSVTDGVVTLPNSVREIYQNAFWKNAVVKKIKFETVSGGTTASSLTIGTDAFVGATGLTEFELPSGMTTIKTGMFKGCSGLIKVWIPNTVSLIEVGAFEGCSALTTVEFEKGNDSNKLILGDGSKKSNEEGNSSDIQITTTLVEGAFGYYKEVKTRVRRGNEVVESVTEEFGLLNLTSIELPKRLSKIGAYAFYGSGLTTVDFGKDSNVEVIAERAFMNSGLTTIKLGEDVAAAADGSYTYALPGQLKELRAGAFEGVEFPANTTIRIPASVTDFGRYALSSYDASCFGVFRNSTVSKIVFEDNSRLNTVYSMAFARNSSDRSTLTEVDFGKNSALTTIEREAFYQCDKLKKVNFGEGSKLQTIGEEAFSNCTALEEIAIPASIISIESSGGTFNNCTNLKSVIFETYTEGDNKGKSSLESIGDRAFYGAGLTSLVFPETIKPLVGGEGLGKELFYNCTNVGTVVVTDSMSGFAAIFDGCLSNWKFATPENSARAFDGTMVYTLDGKNIELIIGDKFDADGKAGKLVLKDSITKIMPSMFAGKTTLKEIVIPAGVTEIGDKAFFDCINLEKVTFATYETDNAETGVKAGKNSLTAIGSEAFRNCISLKEIAVPEGVTVLNPYTFFNCKSLTKVQLNNVVRIGTNGQATEKLGNSYGSVFASCVNLSNIDLSKVEWIQPYSFQHCEALTSVNLKAMVSSSTDAHLGKGAFAYCKLLESVSWSTNLTALPEYAFVYCKSLKNVNNTKTTAIADLTSITSFGNNCFQYCESLVDVRVDGGTLQKLADYMFANCTSLQNLTTAQATQTISPENYLIDMSALLNKYEGDYVFQGCTAIKEARLGGTGSKIGDGCFEGCTGLEKVTVAEDNNYSIFNAKYLFANCTNLKEVDLSNIKKATKLTLGINMFDGCENLSILKFSDTIVGGAKGKGITLAACTFRNCRSLKTEEMKDSNGQVIATAFPFDKVEKFGANAFEGCTGLKNVKLAISTGYFSIRVEGVFKGCTGLVSADLSKDSSTTLYNETFADCVNLKTVNLNTAKIKIIEVNAFKNCRSLVSLCDEEAATENPAATLEKFTVLTKIAANAFEGCASLKKVKLIATGTATLNVYSSAFRNCSGLTEVTLDGNVRVFGANIFAGCDKLQTIAQVNADKAKYIIVDENGFLYTKSESTTKKTTTYTLHYVPAAGYTVENGVLDLTPYAYTQDAATEGWTDIYTVYANAFANCAGIKKIILPDSITSITASMFAGFTDLEEVVLSAETTEIGESAFENTGLKKITYKGYEGTDTFALPETLTTIEKYAFKGTKLENVVLSTAAVSVGTSAFAESTVKTVTVNGENVSFGTSAFADCAELTTVTFNAATAKLGTSMFANCVVLNSVTLPSEITSLPMSLFEGCVKLATVEIPETVTAMQRTFAGSYITSIDVPASVTTLNQTFMDCSQLKTVTLHEGLTSFVVKVFLNCVALEEIVLPEGLTQIGSDVFSGCVNLKKVNIPSTLTKIDNNAFAGCTSLGKAEKFVMPATLTSVGGNIFDGWTAEQKVYIEAGASDVYGKWSNAKESGYSFMVYAYVPYSGFDGYAKNTGATIIWNYKPETTGKTEETGNTGTTGETEVTGGTTNE